MARGEPGAPYTTVAVTTDGREMMLDDICYEGDRVCLRANFDDEGSPEIGTFVLSHRDDGLWILTPETGPRNQ